MLLFDLLRIDSDRAWLITSNSKSSILSVESSDRDSESSGTSSLYDEIFPDDPDRRLLSGFSTSEI